MTVERLAPRLGARVDYATADGSAVAGTDYEARAGTLLFAPGETSKTITIPLRDDAANEPAKAFSLTPANGAADAGATATLCGPASATVVLTDDDAPASPPACWPAEERSPDATRD